ncbi:MAG TPA: hypothetical protein V6C81_05460 [Planktothrix sp.]|jgi:hypothetical protein
MTKPCDDSQLGQLVVGLGWISEEQLHNALAISQETKQPIGRVFVTNGDLTDNEVRTLVQAQQMVRDRHITVSQAKQVLTYSTWLGLSFEDTLIFCNIQTDGKSHDYRLGKLLSASGCVAEEEIEHYAQASKRAGVQLGRLLVLRKQLSKSMLDVCLETQKLVRIGALAYEQAISGLSAIQTALQEFTEDYEDKAVPLGKLLVNAGIISEKQVQDALEVSRINGKPLGQVLIIFAMISQTTLEAALELQHLMRLNRLRAHAAVRALSAVFNENISVMAALASVHDAPGTGAIAETSLSMFLKRTGLFHDIAKQLDAVEQSISQSQQLRELRSVIDENKLRMAVRCTFLIRRSIISFEQGLLAFHHSILNECEVDAFLIDVGWLDEATLDVLAQNKGERHLNIVAA